MMNKEKNEVEPENPALRVGDVGRSVPCFNCGSCERDFYFVKGDYLLEDLDFPDKFEGEEVEIEICAVCEAVQ